MKYCGALLGFAFVGMIMLAGLWSTQNFAGVQAHRWINWFCGAVVILGLAGGVVAAIQGRTAIAIQCAIFAASVAGLMIVLHWIAQLPPPPPPPTPEWYTNPFQTVVERIWCAEFAVAMFVAFGSLAVDAVFGHRANSWLFQRGPRALRGRPVGQANAGDAAFRHAAVGLLAAGADGRPRESAKTERPAQPAADAARKARRRTRQKRRQPGPVYVQSSSATNLPVFVRTLIRISMLIVEKAPLLAMAACSSMVTPIAQSHGGSMASASDLPLGFRLQNSIQSYGAYIGRMFWPGKMMSLHLLLSDKNGHPYVEPSMFWLGLAVVVVLSAVALAAFFLGRRYITFGWLWYVGILVPVIGFVQVGEQAMADRYTYIPYVGLFVAIVWAIGDLMDSFPKWRWPICVGHGRRNRMCPRLVDLLDELSIPDLA